MDFPTLKARIQNYCARSDSTFSNMVETFVMFAEDRIYNGSGKRGDQLYSAPMRVKEMEVAATLTTDAAGRVDLPASCLSVTAVTVADQAFPVQFMGPEPFKVWQAGGYTGEPLRYTVIAGQINIAPAQAVNINVVYYAKPPAVTVENATNDVIAAHPSVYLSAALFEAFLWMREEGVAVQHLAKAKSAIDGANRVTLDNLLGSGIAASIFEPIG